MKFIFALCLLLMCNISQAKTYHALNDNWRYKKLDLPERKFAIINLPHTFNATDADDGGNYYRGQALYEKRFANPCVNDEVLYLEFTSVTLRAQVSLNGRFLGVHEGGYTRFRFPIPSTLVRKQNKLTVIVDNQQNDYVAPLGGDFSVFGGIAKPVYLICAKQVHFDLNDYGSDGIYITPQPNGDHAAKINIRARITNESRKNAATILKISLFDPSGVQVAEDVLAATNPKSKTSEFNQILDIKNVRFWQGVDDPALYTARLEIISQNKTLDSSHIQFGIRSIRFDPKNGLFLNGQPYKAYGVNLHLSQRPGKGVAISEEEQQEDFAALDDLGITALRLAHYPHPQAIYKHANQKGYLVWSEIPLVAKASDDASFLPNISLQLQEMIRQNYNHPSVFVWGLGNEIYNTDAVANNAMAKLQQLAKAEDPSRPSVYANCCGPTTQSIAVHTDLNASNIYHGWYPQQEGEISEWLDAAHKALNGRALAISEYGAGGSPLHQEDPPLRPKTDARWHPEQYQSLVHEHNWQAISSKPYLWASFVWVAFDFASDGRNEGDSAGINDKGLISYDRQHKKDAYYWYQANWAKTPLVYITSRRFTHRNSAAANVKVYSNQSKLALKLNGVLVSSKQVSNHIASWAITLKEGENLIVVETADASLKDSVVWIFDPAKPLQ